MTGWDIKCSISEGTDCFINKVCITQKFHFLACSECENDWLRSESVSKKMTDVFPEAQNMPISA